MFLFHTGNAGKRPAPGSERSEAISRAVDKLLHRQRSPIRKQAQLARLLERLGLLDYYVGSRDVPVESWSEGRSRESESYDDSALPRDRFDGLQTREDYSQKWWIYPERKILWQRLLITDVSRFVLPTFSQLDFSFWPKLIFVPLTSTWCNNKSVLPPHQGSFHLQLQLRAK